MRCCALSSMQHVAASSCEEGALYAMVGQTTELSNKAQDMAPARTKQGPEPTRSPAMAGEPAPTPVRPLPKLGEPAK